jgi:hypothetical protein
MLTSEVAHEGAKALINIGCPDEVDLSTILENEERKFLEHVEQIRRFRSILKRNPDFKELFRLSRSLSLRF